MDATQLFKAGKLTEAVDAQLAVVKARPIDQGARLFLFELVAFSGDLDRAQRQIDALQPEEPEIVMAVSDYRKVVDAEQAAPAGVQHEAQPGFLARRRRNMFACVSRGCRNWSTAPPAKRTRRSSKPTASCPNSRAR